MSTLKTEYFWPPIVLALLAGLSGCGGTKILKEPQPLAPQEALVSGSDARVAGTLDWVIVRDGPGTWAKNADWDEYLLTVRNDSAAPIVITAVTVTDSSETQQSSMASRKMLVKSSKQTAKRYRGEGIKVKAGVGGGALLVTGVLSANVGMSAGAAAVYGSSAAAGAAAGALVLAPVLVVGGVVKGVNNSRVNGEIERRQTKLPLQVESGDSQPLDLFFPISPSPRRVRIDYHDAAGEHSLVLDTSAALQGLHLPDERA